MTYIPYYVLIHNKLYCCGMSILDTRNLKKKKIKKNGKWEKDKKKRKKKRKCIFDIGHFGQNGKKRNVKEFVFFFLFFDIYESRGITEKVSFFKLNL